MRSLIKQAHPIASSLNRCAFPAHPNQLYIPKKRTGNAQQRI